MLGDRRLLVGHRVLGELELLDPLLPPGQRTIARTSIDGVPFDLALGADGEVRVATFVLSQVSGVEGDNRVLRVDPQTLAVLGVQLENAATDYKAMATREQLQVAAGTGNGVVVVSDLLGNIIDTVELAPGEPNATPEDVEFLGATNRLYVLDIFRETLRPVSLEGSPPYLLGEEIPLAWSGQPRVPFSEETSAIEDGLYLFWSVGLVGGDAQNYNRVTCQSCHTDGVSDNLARGRQVPPFWGITDTAPYGTTGGQPSLSVVNGNAIVRHNESGRPPIVDDAQALFEVWLEVFQPVQSVFANADGSLSEEALAGEALFSSIGCGECHQAPIYIPVAPNPVTIEEGIGTGIAPINVPSLRGLWTSAPYLHDGSRRTLRELLIANPSDGHGQLATPLSAQELAQLIAFLRTL
ncbi:MAG: hypothetical protein AAFX85_05765 [Pseudomonadota bacterium]